MRKIEAVIFDMDGLMFDTEKIYFASGTQASKELDMDYSFDVYSKFIGAGYQEEFDGMLEIYGDEELLTRYFNRVGGLVRDSLLNGPVDKMEGLIELLDYLKAEEITAVVASSTHRELVDKLLERLGVSSYFKDVVGGDEVPNSKPDPAIFNLAFEKTGIANKENALVLEDSKNGLLSANGAAIPVIWVPDLLEPTDEMRALATETLPDLHAVIQYIEEKNK